MYSITCSFNKNVDAASVYGNSNSNISNRGYSTARGNYSYVRSSRIYKISWTRKKANVYQSILLKVEIYIMIKFIIRIVIDAYDLFYGVFGYNIYRRTLTGTSMAKM